MNQEHLQAELASRAIAAAVQAAKQHGVASTDPIVLAQGCAVRVHLRPAPVVARVSTLTATLRQPIEEWLRRELEVTDFLAKQGAPVVAPSELLPQGPHWQEGLCVSFWRYVEPAHQNLPDSATAGQLLAVLHQAMRGYPNALPLLAPPLEDIPRSIAQIEARKVLPAEDIALLRETFQALSARLTPEALGPLQPIHGDAHVYNLIATKDGWLWNDFEDVCLGPVAWDLASLDTDGSALAAYPNAPTAETLSLFRELRRLHGISWGFALQQELPNVTVFVAPMLAALRAEKQ